METNGSLQNYINGVWKASTATKYLDVINPATAAVLGQVPLSPEALGVLESVLKPSALSDWVFPSRRGGHVRWVQSAVREIREQTPFDWRPHDLRRTAATFMTRELGVPRLVVSKILNHADSGVTAVYDRASYDPEKRQALDAWGKLVQEIVS